ncbi:MAG: hypothetical protein K2Q01_07860 [Rickettsiales bacterium]|nr:hypothetical protein [Rickettsiales bacterium]
MGLFLFRFWPVLLPLVVYVLWLKLAGRREEKAGRPRPRFSEGPLYWLLFSMLGVAVLCFLFLGATMEGQKGEYVPPHVENGVMVPGEVRQAP